MSNQADVRSVEALKDFRVALGIFSEEVLSALGTVHMEARRTLFWLQHDQRRYWEQQIKRRREQVTSARAEVARRSLAKASGASASYSEQKEILRQAEASLHDAERRAVMVKTWEPALQRAILEYHSTVRRISNLASGDMPRAMAALERMVIALEDYLRLVPPSGGPSRSALEAIVDPILTEAVNTPAPDPDASDENIPGSEPGPPSETDPPETTA